MLCSAIQYTGIYGMLSINIEKIDQFKVNVVLHDLLQDELT